MIAAARPGLETTLVESRQRKCAFLRAAARACGLSVRVVGGRVSRPLPRGLPERVSVVTLRAIRFPIPVLNELSDRFHDARWIFWAGEEDPEVPGSWRQIDRRPLAGSRHRKILLLESR